MCDTLITERLTIRPFVDSGLNDLTALIQDKMMSEYAPYDVQWPTDDASTKAMQMRRAARLWSTA